MTTAHDLLVRSRREQALPPVVEDDATVERLTVLLNVNEPAEAGPSKTTTSTPIEEGVCP
jgi:hypothetical protein